MDFKNEYYGGTLQGPFQKNQELFSIINRQHSGNVEYITRLGIYLRNNYDINILETPIIVSINKKDFQLGKTRALELKDVKITSIYFKQPVNDKMYIDYFYK